MDNMIMETLDRVRNPIERATGLPNEHYTDRDTYEREKERILFGCWSGVAIGADVPEPGDVHPVDFAGMPLLVVRDHEGVVRVFQNTCRHRGMILVENPCNLRGTIRCPYHSWSYNLDGSLRATPHVGGPGMNIDANINRRDLGLIEIRSYLWRDIVFVNISGDAPEFPEYASLLMKRWQEHEQPTFHGGEVSSFSFDVACNWKLAVENYCESYHLPWVHPGLNSYSRLEDHYHIEEQDHFSGQGTMVYRQIEGENGERFPDYANLGSFWAKGAEYVSLFPNVLLAAQRDHSYVILLLPKGHERTVERVEIYYSFDWRERPELADLIARNAHQWHGVLYEDVFVVEGMQRGRHGIHFDGGKFSPVMDSPTHLFHKWVADRLQASVNGKANGQDRMS